MTLVGKSLAEQVRDYLAFRADGGEITRLLLSGYPTPVLQDACRELVRLCRTPGGLEANSARASLHFETALMQDPSDGSQLLVADGYEIGASSDHLVVLRNGGGSLVIAVPPELMDACPETLKSNTFQSFERNARFGSSYRLFQRVARRLVEARLDEDLDSDLLAQVLLSARDFVKEYAGDAGDLGFFSRLDELTGAPIDRPLDLRTVGLLPQRRLTKRLAGGKRDQVARLTRDNLKWQLELVGGLAGRQHKFLIDKYSASPRFPELRSFLAERRLRLDWDDSTWRKEWPPDLLIDDLAEVQRGSQSSLRVTRLRVESASAVVLGLPVCEGPIEISWRVRSNRDQLMAMIKHDGRQVADVDMMDERYVLNRPVSPGLHELGLVSVEADVKLTGETSIGVLVPGGEARLLATIEGQPAGRETYNVPRASELTVCWATLPGVELPPDFKITLQSGSNNHNFDVSDVDHLVLENGIEESCELIIQGYSDGSPTGESASLQLELLEQSNSDRRLRATSVSRSVLEAITSLGQPAIDRPAYEVEISSSLTSAEVQLMPLGGDPDAVSDIQCDYIFGELLGQFEKSFLDHAADPWPRVVVGEVEGRKRSWALAHWPAEATGRWAQALPEPKLKAFLDARETVFRGITLGGGAIRANKLSLVRPDIQTYLEAYVDLLSGVQHDAPLGAAQIAMALMDCAVVPAGVGTSSVTLPSEDVPALALLVSPTHPMRLAWLCGFEDAVLALSRGDAPWSAATVASLESSAFPACLPDWSFSHFCSGGVLDGDNWNLMLPEAVSTPDDVLPADLVRELGLGGRLGGTGASAREVAREIAHYHDLHPFKTSVRIGYLNPGSGEELREAIGMLVSGRVRPTVKLAMHNAEECRYQATMVAPSEENDALVGAAFDDYAMLGDADSAFLERVVFSKQTGVESTRDWGEGAGLEHHLLFGTGIVQVEGRNLDLALHSASPAFYGLLLRQRRSFETDFKVEVLTHTLVSPPCWLAGAERPEDVGLAELLHEVAFLTQSIAAGTRETQCGSWTKGRALVASISDVASEQIDKMHRSAEWVCMMDSQVDVEYFDAPASDGRYVIEYVPRFVAQSGGGSATAASAFVVTAAKSHNVPITAAINRFLTSAYGHEVDDRAADNLAAAVNNVSGRLLLRLVGQPSAAKGATGMGLAQLLYEKADLLGGAVSSEGDMTSLRMLLPVDDYSSYWLQAARALVGSSLPGDHADLLDVEVKLGTNAVSVCLQVLEVKNHKRGYYPASLKNSAALQVVATQRILETLLPLNGQTPKADKDLRSWELSELLDFHMRRTSRQIWGDDREQMQKASGFRRSVRELIASGCYSVDWRGPAGALAGVILHFNPDMPGLPLDSSRLEMLQPDQGMGSQGLAVGYLPFGLGEIRDLLGPGPSEWAHGVAGFLSGEFATPTPEPIAPTPTPEPIAPTPTPEPIAGPVAPVASEISPERIRAAQAFEGFVGNDEAVNRLVRNVAHGLMQQPHKLPVSLALTGPASTGKTTLSKRIAQALELPYLLCQGQSLASVDDLIEKMESTVKSAGGRLEQVGERSGSPVLRFPPMLVFIDEAHELKSSIQEGLLTLLEQNDRYAMVRRGIVEVDDVTFILATTEWGDFAHTLQSRLTEIKLRPYSQEEVARIVGGVYPEWQEPVLSRLAIAGRLVPRVALSNAEELNIACRVEPSVPPSEMLDTLYDEWGIDDEGITELDLRYLLALEHNGGTVGLERLQVLLGISRNELVRNVEPYLIHKQLLRVSGGGREITREGRRYLLRSGLGR